jgi:hypothetical protein
MVLNVNTAVIAGYNAVQSGILILPTFRITIMLSVSIQTGNQIPKHAAMAKFVLIFLLSYPPVSEFYVPKFSNTLSLPSSKVGCFETSVHKIQTSENHPKERLQQSEHGESLKSRNARFL